MCFLLSLWNWKASKEGKDGKVGFGLIDFQIVIKVKNMKWLSLKCRLCVIDI